MSVERTSSSSLSGSPLRPIREPASAEEYQAASSKVGAKEVQKAPSASPVKQVSPDTTPKTEETPFKEQVRPLAQQDIREMLLNKLKQQPTQKHQQILMMMLEHGVEATEQHFETIKTLLKGRSHPRSVESSVVSYSKGLSSSSKSVDMLNSFFGNQAKVATNLEQLTLSLTQFQSVLKQHQQLIDKGLFTGLSSILSEVDDQLKKYTKKSNQYMVNLAKMDHAGLIKDFTLFSSFLAGLDSKILLSDSKEVRQMTQLKGQLQSLRGSLKGMLDTLVVAYILSKDTQNPSLGSDQFYYWQIPNPMVNQACHIDLLIKKEKGKKKGRINPKKTRIVLTFETPDLGEVSVTIAIEEQKLWYTFQTDRGDTKKIITTMSRSLRDQMEALNYHVVGYQTIPKKLDIKKLLLPAFDLNKLTRIVTEV